MSLLTDLSCSTQVIDEIRVIETYIHKAKSSAEYGRYLDCKANLNIIQTMARALAVRVNTAFLKNQKEAP